MGYEVPRTLVTYTYKEHDFGAGAGAFAIKGPPGKKGHIEHIGMHVTETFTNVTTPGYIRLGTATDADFYAEVNCGTAADTDYLSADAGAINHADIAPDAQVEVALIAPTGGTPAGIGIVQITVAWW